MSLGSILEERGTGVITRVSDPGVVLLARQGFFRVVKDPVFTSLRRPNFRFREEAFVLVSGEFGSSVWRDCDIARQGSCDAIDFLRVVFFGCFGVDGVSSFFDGDGPSIAPASDGFVGDRLQSFQERVRDPTTNVQFNPTPPSALTLALK